MNQPRRLFDLRDVLRTSARAAAQDARALGACRRLLAGLRQADAQRGSDLERTLRTYYQCGASVSATADAMFLHRNSVRYRLDRVRSLVGCAIDDPNVAAALIAAFAVSDEAAAVENSPSDQDGKHAAQRPQ